VVQAHGVDAVALPRGRRAVARNRAQVRAAAAARHVRRAPGEQHAARLQRHRAGAHRAPERRPWGRDARVSHACAIASGGGRRTSGAAVVARVAREQRRAAARAHESAAHLPVPLVAAHVAACERRGGVRWVDCARARPTGAHPCSAAPRRRAGRRARSGARAPCAAPGSRWRCAAGAAPRRRLTPRTPPKQAGAPDAPCAQRRRTASTRSSAGRQRNGTGADLLTTVRAPPSLPPEPLRTRVCLRGACVARSRRVVWHWLRRPLRHVRCAASRRRACSGTTVTGHSPPRSLSDAHPARLLLPQRSTPPDSSRFRPCAVRDGARRGRRTALLAASV